jgi:hypothetical protein
MIRRAHRHAITTLGLIILNTLASEPPSPNEQATAAPGEKRGG